jgi:RHS repeat-associated protein
VYSLDTKTLGNVITAYGQVIKDLRQRISDLQAARTDALTGWRGDGANAWAFRVSRPFDVTAPKALEDLERVHNALSAFCDEAKRLRRDAEMLESYLSGSGSSRQPLLRLEEEKSHTIYQAADSAQFNLDEQAKRWTKAQRILDGLQCVKLSIGSGLLINIQNKRSKVENFAAAYYRYEHGVKTMVENFISALSALPLSQEARAASEYAQSLLYYSALLRLDIGSGLDLKVNAFCLDPVNMASGNFFIEKELIDLLPLSPLTFTLYYNSCQTGPSLMGRGFSHNHGLCLKDNGGYLLLRKGDASTQVFLREATDLFVSTAGIKETVVASEDGYALVDEKGYSLSFNRQGRLISVADCSANSFSYHYDSAQRLTEVCSNTGAALLLSYDEAGTLSRVSDHCNRSVRFKIDDGRLSSILALEGELLGFSYDEEGYLSAILNAQGKCLLANTYDEVGRVICQEYAAGAQAQCQYDTQKHVTVLNEQGLYETVFSHDEQDRLVEILYPDKTKVKRSYNERNQCVEAIDRLGCKTAFSYNEWGALVKKRDPSGVTSEIEYDAEHRPCRIVKNGRTLASCCYDDCGKLSQNVDAAGEVTSFSYNEWGQLQSIDVAGCITQFYYDNNNQLCAAVDPTGVRLKLQSDELGRITKLEDAEGAFVELAYSDKGNLLVQKAASGRELHYSYTALGQLSQVTDATGAVLGAYTYCASGRRTKTVDAREKQWEFFYDEQDQLTSCVGPTGLCFACEYDGEGNIIAIRNAKGATLCYAYDARGRCVSLQGADGQTANFAYDCQDNLTSAMQADGATVSFLYNGHGNLIQATDQRGGIWSYIHDKAGRRTQSKDPLGNKTRYEWSLGENLSSVTNALGHKTSYSYDAAGRISKAEFADGSFEKYSYNRAGRLCCLERSALQPIEFSYDAAGRMIKQCCGGDTVRFAYDEWDNLVKRTDQLGHSTHYEYDQAKNLCSVRGPGDAYISYIYDANNQLIEVSRDKAAPLCYLRDELSQLVGITNVEGQQEQRTYDKQGNLLSITERDGRTTHLYYDVCARLTGLRYQDGQTATAAYDVAGNLISVQDWCGTVSVEYDVLNRPVRIVHPGGQEIGYTYDALSRKTSMTYPNGVKVAYAYNEQGKLLSIAGGSEALKYCYDRFGRLIEKSVSAGAKCCYEYDSHGHIALVAIHDAEGEFLKAIYTYDIRGNKTSKATHRRADGANGCAQTSIDKEEYVYDAAKRLVKVIKNGEHFTEYAYDSWGNRTKKKTPQGTTEYCYNKLLQLTQKTEGSDIWEYLYDARGNLIRETLNKKHQREFSYNSQGYLERMHSTTGEEVCYRYNALGQMVSRTENGKTTHFIFDTTRPRAQLLCVMGEDTAQSFIWDGDAALILDDESCCFLATDDLGSPLCLFGGAGAVLEQYSFDEYGCTQTVSTRHPFGYTGYINEPTADICYAQERYYSPGLGRFISPDKIKGFAHAPETQNEYAYCCNQPLDHVDRDGLFSSEVKTPLDAWSEFWNEVVLGENVDIAPTINANGVTAREYMHVGGEMIVWNKGLEEKPTGLSFSGPSIPLPGNQSISTSLVFEKSEPGSIIPIGIYGMVNLSNLKLNTVASMGAGSNASGFTLRQENVSKTYPGTGGYLATSLSTKTVLADWPTVIAAAGIVLLSVGIIVLFADDLTGAGIGDDVLIAPALVGWNRCAQVLSGAVPTLQQGLTRATQFGVAFRCPY